MGKTKQIFRPIFIIIISLLLVQIVISIYLIIDFENQYKTKLNKKNEYLSIIDELKEKDAKNKEEINNLKIKYNNIDEQIEIKRKEFFKKAKELENKVLNNETDKKIVYLTFDDGPYTITSHTIMDILDKEDILVTYFLLGKESEECDKVYKREYYSGHTLANHTYSHKISRTNGIYVSTGTFISDVLKQEKFLSKKFNGYKTSIVRFPGGSGTAGSLKNDIKKELYNNGYGWVDWDLGTGDGNGTDKGNQDIAYNNIFNNLNDKKIVVVLMHDYSRVTAKALPKIIKEFRNRNFVFLPLFYDSVKVNKN